METYNATDVRNRWSEYSDSVIREKPLFIKKTREHLFLSSIEQLVLILDAYHFTAKKFRETDGSITLSLNEFDIAENAATEADARLVLAKSILEYAEEYFNEFKVWNTAANRKKHLPYVLKALVTGDAKKIGEMLVCRAGNK